MDANRIGKTIAKLRKKEGLTQLELGNRLFVTDKAVSKWERGLSLPDIALLENLAKELNTDIYEILQIENDKESNLEEILKEEKEKITSKIRKRLLFVLTPVGIILFTLFFTLFPFGYNVEHIRYTHNTDKLINLAVPKFSFGESINEDSFSYKNFRGKSVLKSEIKNYLDTLEHISCNGTTYYYDKIANVTVINYRVSDVFLYNNIDYQIRNGNYCSTFKVEEVSRRLKGKYSRYTLYDLDDDMHIVLDLSTDIVEEKPALTASMRLYYKASKKEKYELLENSYGTFDIIDDELIYSRKELVDQKQGLQIPVDTKFIIKEQKLIMKDDYLDEFKKYIILK